MKANLKDFEAKMQKSCAALETELKSIRVGRASAAVLDKITVDYYGSATPINQIAAISTTDARTLVITPWDASTVKEIEKAILASDLGINPQNDGKVIRLTFPSLTEERRKEVSKQVAKCGEDSKVAVRNIRREANDFLKNEKKAGTLTEDDVKSGEKDAQDLTDKYIKNIDALVAAKTKEVMEI
ncbi:MAG: ribosome recycling factor [Ruminococcaceae bacterium]|nr:ribosome recycling factor [Oscillospiraceae bacterium]